MVRGGRSRPRKGQTRMDAAIDALKPLGYSRQLVVSTVRQLLDVYGVEGWPFIEEASYSVLLDAILEKDDAHTKEDLLGSKNGGIGITKASAAESSTLQPIELGTARTRESASAAIKAKLTERSVHNGNLSNSEGEGSSCSKHRVEVEITFEEEKAFPTRNHGPCHGWISDSDEPLQLIQLKPARISRWDQLPRSIGAL